MCKKGVLMNLLLVFSLQGMIYLLSNSNYGMTCKEKLSCPLDHIYSQFLGKQEKTI